LGSPRRRSPPGPVERSLVNLKRIRFTRQGRFPKIYCNLKSTGCGGITLGGEETPGCVLKRHGERWQENAGRRRKERRDRGVKSPKRKRGEN